MLSGTTGGFEVDHPGMLGVRLKQGNNWFILLFSLRSHYTCDCRLILQLVTYSETRVKS